MVEILNDWKFYAFLMQFSITIICFCIIKFNDFKHLNIKVIDISTEVKDNTKKLNKIDKQLAVDSQRIKTLELTKKK